jgi:glycosyltransferase involved in cell wall biosynthesis
MERQLTELVSGLLAGGHSVVEDVLVDGRNGWFVERDADVIAARLRALERDRPAMRAMGRAAREATASFEWSRVVDAYEGLYRWLGATPGGADRSVLSGARSQRSASR